MVDVTQRFTPPTSATLARTAWLIVALLWPVALLNYLDRQMLAAMKFSVMNDIPDIRSEANWGYMLAQFKWVYAFLSPVGGYIADRFSRRITISASLFVWSAVTWATGHVTTYEGLLWTRTLMGISEAFYIPAALALIADYHSSRTRSRAVGLHQVAIYVGIIIGGFSGYVADAPDLGWRMAFDVTGVVGIIYAIPLLLLLRDAPRATNLTTTATTAENAAAAENALAHAERPHLSMGTALKTLLTNGSFLLLVACFTLPALAGWVVKDWMPALLKDMFNIGQGQAGVSATLYVNLASLAGAFLGGWAADRLMRRTLRGRIIISALGMSLLIPSLFGVGNSSTLTGAIVFLTLFGLGWGFFDCNNMPILSQIVGPQLRATGYGIMNFVSISCGGLADWGFGVLRDRHVPLNLIFGAFAATAFVSVLLVLLIKPRPESTAAPA
jgi:MFS transporter, Spinster family, sphingosine-1-phosphate transporter